MPEAEEEQRRLHLDVLPYWLEMERAEWEISRFSAFAPKSGQELETAIGSLKDEAQAWMANKGGNIQSFLQKQLRFNNCVRITHAELLGLQKW